MTRPLLTAVLSAAVLAGGCSLWPGGSDTGATHSHRFRQPPREAAQCFARNAEDHSSALVAEVASTRDGAQVVVRVKNGVLYATADLARAGTASSGRIVLMVHTTGSRSDLLDALTRGC